MYKLRKTGAAAVIIMHAMYMNTCWPSPSNQSSCRQIFGYQRGVGDHRIGQWCIVLCLSSPSSQSYKIVIWWWRGGVMDRQIAVHAHLTMHLVHPNLICWAWLHHRQMTLHMKSCLLIKHYRQCKSRMKSRLYTHDITCQYLLVYIIIVTCFLIFGWSHI